MLGKKALQRSEARIEVLPVEVKGLLSLGSEQQLPFMVWDITRHGLGILLSDPLEPGVELSLTLRAPYAVTTTCRVVWCEAQEADYDFQEPSYRAGLEILLKEPNFAEVIFTLEKK